MPTITFVRSSYQSGRYQSVGDTPLHKYFHQPETGSIIQIIARNSVIVQLE